MTKDTIITWVVVIVVIIIALLGWWYLGKGGQPNTIMLSSDKDIASFDFTGLNPPASGVVDGANHRIDVTVASSTDLTNLVPTITIPQTATISPQSGMTQDFTNPITYTVTAQDGSTQSYTVTITQASAK